MEVWKLAMEYRLFFFFQVFTLAFPVNKDHFLSPFYKALLKKVHYIKKKKKLFNLFISFKYNCIFPVGHQISIVFIWIVVILDKE